MAQISKNRRNLIILILAVAFFSKLVLALMASHPGHGDTAFYYTLAENISTGRGPVIDYIWHYLSKPATITHQANDFWMPLASVIMSLFMIVLGKSLLAALLPSVLFSIGIAILTYFWSRNFTESGFIPLAAGGLILFLPLLFAFSLLTDSTTYYVFFITAAFFCFSKAATKPNYYYFSAIFIGLAHFTRQDGVLLVPVLITAILLSPNQIGKKIKYMAISLLIYLAILSPVFAWNLHTNGSLISSAPAKTMFITQPEDPYSYNKEFTLQTYLALGWSNIIAAKVKAGLANIKVLYNSSGDLILIIALIGLVELFSSSERRKRWRIYFPPLLYGSLLFLFYSIVAGLPGAGGAFGKSILSIFPFLAIVTVDTLQQHITSKKILTAAVVIVGLLFFAHGLHMSANNVAANNRMGSQLGELKTILQNQPPNGQETIIMTRDPWEVNYSTRYKAIQIPCDDLETIYRVAAIYKANYLLLPAPRPSLDNIYSGETTDTRFELVAAIPNSNLKLFRIKFAE